MLKSTKKSVSAAKSTPEKAAPQVTAAPTVPIRSAPASPPVASEEQVRLLAYQKWEAAGRPPGDGAAFWLEAERELRRTSPR